VPDNLSERTVQHIFKTQYGLSPKQFLALNRFRHSLRLMEANPEASLSDIAYAAGFYDQPHFIREFRKHTMLTPKQFHREELGMANFFLP
jgi:AraC-like DNA-binding protein